MGVRWGQRSKKERNKFLFTEFNINKETLAAGGFRGLNSGRRRKKEKMSAVQQFLRERRSPTPRAELEIFHRRHVLFPQRAQEGREPLK